MALALVVLSLVSAVFIALVMLTVLVVTVVMVMVCLLFVVCCDGDGGSSGKKLPTFLRYSLGYNLNSRV